MHALPTRSLVAAALAGVVAGCAAPEPKDDTPLLRSAVVVSEVSNGGIKGQFGTEGRRTDKIVGDIRRVDSESKFSGSILSRIGGSRDTSEIVRLDRDVLWYLNNDAETYQECPLTGCLNYLELLGATEQDYEQEEDLDECTLNVVSDDVSLVRTGERRTIGEYETEEYLFAWKAQYADPAGGTFRNEVTSQIWTTPLVGEPAEAAALDERFQANYRSKLGLSPPPALVAALPGGAFDALSEYLLDTIDERAADALYAKIDALGPVGGYPISRSVEWRAAGQTCATPKDPERDDEDDLDTGSFKGLLASVGKKIVRQEVDKKVAEKRRAMELEPMFSFVETVESIDIGDIRESRLTVPADYDLIERR